MQDNVLALGPVPAQEARARPGDSDYPARAFAQCQRFIALWSVNDASAERVTALRFRASREAAGPDSGAERVDAF